MVNFLRNGALVGGVPLTGGTATFTTSPLAFGSHSFTATYEGGDVVPVLMQIINSILLDD
jgi:hypothetical protein